MNLLLLGATILFATATTFVVFGVVHDAHERRVGRMLDVARGSLALVLFADSDDAARAALPALTRVPKTLLLSMIQNVAVDLGDAEYERLRTVVADARLASRILALGRRRAWRRRVQGAHLQHLLRDDVPGRLRLLEDPHPLVRARAAESLPRQDIVANAERLLEMLDDPVHSVRVGAQQALLRGDSSIGEPLCVYLWSGARRGTSLALEVAANLPDPRYGPVLRHHAEDRDPLRRAMVARALGAGATLESLPTLLALLDDEEADVRATAAAAVAALGVDDLAGAVGRKLADPSWDVRREAGLALDSLGPSGAVVLRSHLFSDDRYARDMARQVLDAAAARHHQLAILLPESLPSLDDALSGEGAA